MYLQIIAHIYHNSWVCMGSWFMPHCNLLLYSHVIIQTTYVVNIQQPITFVMYYFLHFMVHYYERTYETTLSADIFMVKRIVWPYSLIYFQ